MITSFAHEPFIGAFGWGPFGSLFGAGAIVTIAVIFTLWSLFWKGLALWHAARNNEKAWFVVFLLVHTLGILEIIYLFGFRKDRHTNPIFPHHTPPAPPAATPPESSGTAA